MEMQVLGRRAPKARPAQRPLHRYVSVNTGARPPAPLSLALCTQPACIRPRLILSRLAQSRQSFCVQALLSLAGALKSAGAQADA